MIHSMVAHLDAVTSLAVDPNGIYLMSGSKGFLILFYGFYISVLLSIWQKSNFVFFFFSCFFSKQAMIVPLDYGIWTARHVCKK